MRRLNSVAVLRSLHSGGTLTLTELVKLAGLSRPTCEDVVNDLLDQGWAVEVLPNGDGPRQVGRPARRFRFRAEAGYVLAVDIGAHKVLAVVADLLGDAVATTRCAVDPVTSATERLTATSETIGRCLTASGIEPGRLLSTVAATSGIVDDAGHVKLSTALPQWTGLDLRAEVLKMLPPAAAEVVAIENDIALAALAEHWRGVARHATDIVYMFAGRRMGAGLLIGGVPHRGHHGAAGEIGTLDLLGWEGAYRRFNRQAGDDTGDHVQETFEAARRGDCEALDIVDAFGKDLATGLAIMVLSVDPELVVVGGGISQAGELLIEPVRRHLADLTPFPPEVVASILGDESVALGAVRLALNHVEQNLFTVAE
ncbi:ROK family transcriptional regulator [Streptomyces fildesensis]|uniref:ROK family transcriptional regulator n=1 Tax=Streptomyces fildesensis TaxID=375757 RepID=UPI0018DF0EB2|nr:ROK family transcriptional regulator [Streptomyces fildesensis]